MKDLPAAVTRENEPQDLDPAGVLPRTVWRPVVTGWARAEFARSAAP